MIYSSHYNKDQFGLIPNKTRHRIFTAFSIELNSTCMFRETKYQILIICLQGFFSNKAKSNVKDIAHLYTLYQISVQKWLKTILLSM